MSASPNGPNASRKTDVADVRQGVRTHMLLVLAMALVTGIVTGLCLLLIRHRLRVEVSEDLARDLDHSVAAFQDLQSERLAALDRENALLADLPTLKALMTSSDDVTIQDGATEFWQLSGNDLFALADSRGRIVAAYTNDDSGLPALHDGLESLLASPQRHYLIDGGALYACSVRPLYFGGQNGTLLGYVVSGASIARSVRHISQPAGVEAAFLSDGKVFAGTLPSMLQPGFASQPLLSHVEHHPFPVQFGKTRFLAATEELSAAATSPLRLVVLKSFEPAEQSIDRIDRMVLSIGLLALVCGTGLMIIVSTLLTRPLEDLAKSVRAFGLEVAELRVPRYGTTEVRQLSMAFSAMQQEIQLAHSAVLQSERLATIGRMASSVSHDFRHYLAAIYANAEFLASSKLSEKERSEIFADIRAAVLGTTDMIESLLIFSRTGSHSNRAPELVATLVERAVALLRLHPDAERVDIFTRYGDPTDTAAIVDAKQIERAVFNLMLNACQSARSSAHTPLIEIAIETTQHDLHVNVTDNGAGVPERIRAILFEPFVSEGKQKGTGLGLTLAQRIASEHGGEVVLLSSRPGQTVFQLRIARGLPPEAVVLTERANPQNREISHENVQP